MTRSLRIASVALILPLAVLGGACKSATTTSETYCTTLDEYKQGIQSLVALDPSTATSGQYLTAWDDVLNTYNQLTEIQQDQAQQEQQAFDAAHKALGSAVNQLPTSATGQQAHDVLSPLIDKVDTAEQALDTAACTSPSPS
jgi:hypothetical protein